MKTSVYTTWPLYLSLLVLILNDHVFKLLHPGFVTGKLSDFAGIFLITLVLRGLFEKKALLISICVIAGFVWWKSSYSQVLIDAINALSPWLVVRTVDYSDLMALLIIPLAHYMYENRAEYSFKQPMVERIKIPVMVLTALGIMGTSVVMPQQKYEIRKQEENQTINIPRAIEIMTQVLEAQELECVRCSPTDETGLYSNDKINLSYTVMENSRGIEIDIAGAPGGFFGGGSWDDMEEIKRRLQNTLGNEFKDMEFVMKLGGRY